MLSLLRTVSRNLLPEYSWQIYTFNRIEEKIVDTYRKPRVNMKNQNVRQSRVSFILAVSIFSAFLLPLSAKSSITPTSIVDNVPDSAPEKLNQAGKTFKKISSISKIEFKNVSLSSTTGRSDVLLFDLPQDAVSFSIHVYNKASKDYSYVYQLKDPKAQELISPAPLNISPAVLKKAGRGQAVSLNATQAETFLSISNTLVPNTPDVSIIPGKWSLIISKENPKLKDAPSRDVTIIIKRQSEKAKSTALRVLKMNMYFAQGNTVGVKEQFNAKDILSTYFKQTTEFYKKLGIQLEVNKIVSLKSKFNEAKQAGVDGLPNAEFVELMTTSHTQPNELNIFFLQENNYVSYSGIANLAGASTPYIGPETVRNVICGVIVQAGSYQYENVLAHEIGHHLGLYHTNIDHLKDTKSESHLIYGNQGFNPNFMQEGAGDWSVSKAQIEVLKLNPAISVFNQI
jgi:hypothetical protein